MFAIISVTDRALCFRAVTEGQGMAGYFVLFDAPLYRDLIMDRYHYLKNGDGFENPIYRESKTKEKNKG